ncbi:MAG: efflux RND transporter periplasmic adaptor subunit, partial [Myxococcales bacterium]|nr:efflux RND transporter periplasmic adaptor subunit [Myxococcales bacterium]
THPQLVVGGRVEAGATLVELDARDYRLAIRQQRAQVRRAQVALQQEESRKAVAEREWKLVGDQAQVSERGKKLALREPQREMALADVEAAESALAQGQLALARTKVEAPFNAIVRQEAVEIGQIARPGQGLATLIGTDEWWVQVSIPMAELNWIEIPGSDATVVQRMADGTARTRPGKVVRALADVEPGSQMARVIVEVQDPLDSAGEGKSALLLGATVDVRIEGRPVDNVLAVPRAAVRDGDRLWTVSGEETLAVVPIDIVRREQDRVLVRGLDAAARVVGSRIAAPVAGMKLRVVNIEPSDAEAAR